MKRKSTLILAGLIIIALGVGFYFTPYWAVHNMKKAAQNRDARALSAYIDFPVLKENLKAEFTAMVARESGSDMSGNPYGAVSTAMTAAFINAMIDRIVTPEGLAILMEGEKPGAPEKAYGNGEKKSDNAGACPNTETTMGYQGFNRFMVTFKDKGASDAPVRMIFKRSGIISWKLVALRIPMPEEDNTSIELSSGLP